jgi:phosphate transport system permease protein
LPRAEATIPGPGGGASAPRPGFNIGDRAYGVALHLAGGFVLLVAGLIVIELADVARPVRQLGLGSYLFGTDWDPVTGSFGALTFVYGTLVTSLVAIVLALPVSVGLALFLSEMGPRQLRPPVAFAIETLAAIPSVIYGLWGLFVLVPVLRDHVQPFLGKWLGFLPLFKGPPIGLGFLAGGMILSIMILPTIASVTIEVLKTVPLTLKEAALALGATRWEAIRMAVLPYSRAGIAGATLLGLGRALGETMAVTMVIGNSPQISASLFALGYSLPAVIANEFAEATGALYTGALAGLGLVLFGITVILNGLARVLIMAVARGPRARAA